MNESKQKNQIIELYLLMLVDVITIICSYTLANLIRHGKLGFSDQSDLYVTILKLIILVCVLYSFILNHNRDFIKRGHYIELLSLTKMNIVIIFIVTFGLFFMKESLNFARLLLGYFIIINEILAFFSHIILKKYLRLYFESNKNKAKIMVITEIKYAEQLLKHILEKNKYEHEVTAIALWDEKKNNRKNICNIPIIANKNNLLEISKQHALDEVFVHLPHASRNELETLIYAYQEMGIICHYNIDVAGLNIKNHCVGEFADYAVITYATNFVDYRKRFLKRVMDIVGSIIGLAITFIIFPFVAIAIKMDSKGPIFFSQVRIGKNGRKFKMYKFRSMHINAEMKKKELMNINQIDGLMFKLDKDPRVTRIGKILRKTSIDEFPQFYNILRGDMSLVGTRPPTLDEFEQYNGYYRRRLSITPGLTGLWQVNGRSKVDNFEDVVKYDLDYIDYWSLSLDIKIIIQTIYVVIFRKGAK